MATEKIQGILDTVGGLSVLELNELVKELQEQWGVTAAVAGPAASSGPSAAAPAAEVEVQTEFSVILKDAGAQKIQVIKAVREVVPSLGLKEAKDVVDAAPKAVVENVTQEDAQKAKEKLEAAGATVEIK
jgi:large subunit ribosomal protein L7/L12